MAWYADLTPYAYTSQQADTKNVGWLQRGMPYRTGDVPADFLAELEYLPRENQTMGWHECDLCPPRPTFDVSGQMQVASGGCELHVRTASGLTYAAPSLLIHYITAHRYLPPLEFIESVLVLRRARLARRQAHLDAEARMPPTSRSLPLEKYEATRGRFKGNGIGIAFSPEALYLASDLPGGERAWARFPLRKVRRCEIAFNPPGATAGIDIDTLPASRRGFAITLEMEGASTCLVTQPSDSSASFDAACDFLGWMADHLRGVGVVVDDEVNRIIGPLLPE